MSCNEHQSIFIQNFGFAKVVQITLYLAKKKKKSLHVLWILLFFFINILCASLRKQNGKMRQKWDQKRFFFNLLFFFCIFSFFEGFVHLYYMYLSYLYIISSLIPIPSSASTQLYVL